MKASIEVIYDRISNIKIEDNKMDSPVPVKRQSY